MLLKNSLKCVILCHIFKPQQWTEQYQLCTQHQYGAVIGGKPRLSACCADIQGEYKLRALRREMMSITPTKEREHIVHTQGAYTPVSQKTKKSQTC